MPQLASLSSLIPALTTGSQVASTGANLYQGYKNQQYQDQLRSIAEDPSKMNAYAQQFVHPLNAGLEKGVANEAQAYAAERGLAQSPGPQSEIIAQAIAPYVQQNQQNAYNIALRSLGVGGGAQPSDTQTNLTQTLAGLKGLTQYGNLAAIKNTASPSNPMNQMGIINSSLSDLIPLEGSEGQVGLNDFYGNNFAAAPAGGF